MGSDIILIAIRWLGVFGLDTQQGVSPGLILVFSLEPEDTEKTEGERPSIIAIEGGGW